MNILITLIIAFLIIDGFIIFFVIIKKRNSKLSSNEIEQIKQMWGNIKNELNSNPKQAIMDADKILDHILKRLNYTGTLGEMMKQAAPLFTDQNGIWSAHKLRNKIAHELNFNPDFKTAERALKQFQKAYKDLGVKI